jgi:hypothetical protein
MSLATSAPPANPPQHITCLIQEGIKHATTVKEIEDELSFFGMAEESSFIAERI